MKIALVTDAWSPQINGVVRALEQTVMHLRRKGHDVLVIHAADVPSMPCPTYPEIPLALEPFRKVREALTGFVPEAIHIATEGPLGLAARIWCVGQGLAFTTSFHTRFPEYVAARFPVPVDWGYAFLRWFHGAAAATMVSNQALATELSQRGMKNLVLWSRGVDAELFHPWENHDLRSLLPGSRPAFVYFGRVAVEKNVEAFLQLNLPGSKHVIGDGPLAPKLRANYPEVYWHGMMQGETLSRHLAAADVMVFPSRTDTLGLVVREANACGVPVAAYPVLGPAASIQSGYNGILGEDLAAAAMGALALRREDCRAAALAHDWSHCTDGFLSHLAPVQAN
ncbi:MAG: glycosyltransferase family 1 protein [Acidithiobacillus sp.]|nr:glycosyltransferase family 1 protein [Acidithiobacillus sp.]